MDIWKYQKRWQKNVMKQYVVSSNDLFFLCCSLHHQNIFYIYMSRVLHIYMNLFFMGYSFSTFFFYYEIQLRPAYETKIVMQHKFEIMNVRYNSTIVGETHVDMTNIFSGTLKGKFKSLRTYTEKARHPAKAHMAVHDHKAYIKEIKQVLKWALLFKEKFFNHPLAEPTLRQLKEELIEARRDTESINGFDTSLSMQYVMFMGEDE